MYLTMAHSSRIVKSGLQSLYCGFLSNLGVNCRNRYALQSNRSVDYDCVITSIIGSTVIHMLAFWQSMNSFGNPVSAESIQQAFAAIWRSVSALSTLLEICTFWIIFAKPGLMAITLVILALPSFRSLWLFPTAMLSSSLNCWSHSSDSEDLVWPVTPTVLMNAPEASRLRCAINSMWFHNAGHSIPEASWLIVIPESSSGLSQRYQLKFQVNSCW